MKLITLGVVNKIAQPETLVIVKWKVLGVTIPEVVMNKIYREKLLCVTTYHKTS